MRNLLYYKYVHIPNVKQFREIHYAVCDALELKGRILVADEGINGCVTGSLENTQKYMEYMKNHELFSDMEFKEGLTGEHGFKKLIVRVRPEIVTFETAVDLNNKAPYIEPEDFKSLLDSDEDVILIDARNNYESLIGKFEGAITPNLFTFKKFHKVAKTLKDKKDKRIVTYCTGGIRCEKFSAFLVEQGFSNVQQLHGGIIRYGKECGTDHWKGKCFVFDNRIAINIDPENPSSPISSCTHCDKSSDDCHNCLLPSCDKRFIMCGECVELLEGCCSATCLEERKRYLRDKEAVSIKG